MAKVLPPHIVNAVRAEIFHIADVENYLFKTRRENGAFMDMLVDHPKVGGVLSQYLPKERIRTYVKDGVLRVYTKLKRDIALPVGDDRINSIISEAFRSNGEVIDRRTDLVLVKLDDNSLCIIALGTILKWETALRKSLEFYCHIIKAYESGVQINILLLLAKLSLPFTKSDLAHLISTLKIVNVHVFISDNEL